MMQKTVDNDVWLEFHSAPNVAKINLFLKHAVSLKAICKQETLTMSSGFMAFSLGKQQYNSLNLHKFSISQKSKSF